MDNKIFKIDEIIQIVRDNIEEIEFTNMYGETFEYEGNLKDEILDKINSLDGDDYKKFTKALDSISKKVYDIKNGQLNELNLMHTEIEILSKKYLNHFIVE